MRKTTLAVAAGAALALVLTGCGAKSENGTASAIGASGSSGLAAPFQSVLDLANASKQGTQKSKSSKVSMEMTAAGKTITAQGVASYDAGNPQMSLTLDTDGQQTEMRVVDKTLYMKLPAAQLAQMGTDKPWVKISPDADDPLSQSLSGGLGSAGEQSDPTKMLDQIGEAGRIISSDQTQLNGQEVNHYKVEIDLAKAMDKFTESMPAEAKAQLEQQLKGKDVKIPAELWIDKNQLPVQITMDESAVMQAVGAGSAGTGKMTLKYSDWGTAVSVAAPPADQVSDLSELLKKLGG